MFCTLQLGLPLYRWTFEGTHTRHFEAMFKGEEYRGGDVVLRINTAHKLALQSIVIDAHEKATKRVEEIINGTHAVSHHVQARVCTILILARL